MKTSLILMVLRVRHFIRLATFKQSSATESGPYDYNRGGNPTRDALERVLAKLDKADHAFCFTSGMAALATVTHLVGAGEEIVAGDDMYGGSDRLLSKVTPKNGIVAGKFIRPRRDCFCCWSQDQTCVDKKPHQPENTNF
ncbi:cystathionine beta-lyase, chloroplastic-like [Punica granatum]|uniref:Cystathionine beta-lyase, chloroplastic-like n=1 Tax=Punica granatum TaxID=22663 RepID=A0A6P8E2B2_PUNGR|nr:cystathionine beta-lyase, chloroplastic-like [Punica granatum]XP_031404061.1 cystathionine beta-lyase, chloroplastic-like [Punica granatum]